MGYISVDREVDLNPVIVEVPETTLQLERNIR